MALLGGSWRLICMAGWCNYIYCSECDRPLRKTKRRIVMFRTTNNKGGFFSHCLHCGLSFASLSPTFWRNVSLPALGVSLVAFAIALSTNNPDAWAFGLLSAAPLLPFFRMRKRCKPIMIDGLKSTAATLAGGMLSPNLISINHCLHKGSAWGDSTNRAWHRR
jgi:hypothetical protein